MIQLELSPPPTAPVPAEEQLRLAINSGKIVKRSTCGAATLLTLDSGVSDRRTELVVATFDPTFVLGDRKQGRWSIMPIEQASDVDGVAWGDCLADPGHPTLFVAITPSTYTVLVHVVDHAVVLDRGARPTDAKVSLKGGKRLELQVGATTRLFDWPVLR